MSPTPGLAAPKVTQHVAGTPTEDAYGNEVPAFTNRPIRALAQFPGNSIETDNAAQDEVLADVVLLLQATVAVKATDEFTLTDAQRYRVLGQPGRYSHPITGTAVTQVNLRRIS
jgi:hypothetical protein